MALQEVYPVPASMALLDRFHAFQADMNNVLVERASTVELALIALLSREHFLQLGSPGIGKTMLVDQLHARIAGAKRFKKLLSASTVPDELLGPVDLLEYADNKRWVRHHARSVVEAHLVFLDEVFKSNSVVLNLLLGIMNEREVDEIGADTVLTVPLISLFGASNEIPEDSGLRAFEDRFVLREIVQDIGDDTAFVRMLTTPKHVPPQALLSLQDIYDGQAAVEAVKGTNEVLQGIVTLRHQVSEAGIYVSPRRWFKALTLIKARAWLNGLPETTIEDMTVLANSLWTNPKERGAVERLVYQVACPLYLRALEVEDQATEVFRSMPKQDAADFHSQGENILQQITDMHNVLYEAIQKSHARDTARAVASLNKVKGYYKAVAAVLFENVSRLQLAGK